MSFFSGLGTVASALFGIGDRIEERKQQNLDNQYRDDMFDYQREQFEYQKSENAINRERQDNAYQRTVEDMRKAGLSPSMLSGGVNESVVNPSVNSPSSVAGGISGSTDGIIGSIQNAQALSQEKDSLDFEKFKHNEDLQFKIMELDEQIAQAEKFHQDTTRLEEQRQKLEAWSNQINQDKAEEEKRQNRVREKQETFDAWSNLIERGTTANNNSSKSWNGGFTASVNILKQGGSGKVEGGNSESGNYAEENPFKQWYTSSDVPMLAQKFPLDKTSIYYNGEVPCFVTDDPNDKNSVLVYDPSLPSTQKLKKYTRNSPEFKHYSQSVPKKAN